MLSPGASTKKGKEEILYETCDSGSSEPQMAVYRHPPVGEGARDTALDLGPRAGHHQGFR